jgi:hypothetical protein
MGLEKFAPKYPVSVGVACLHGTDSCAYFLLQTFSANPA